MNPIVRYDFPDMVALKILNLCIQRKVLLSTTGVVFYVWQREDRLVVAFDPNVIDTKRVDDDFAHRLSTRLQGRLVVRTNSRGMFLQVGFEVPPAAQPLEERPLDLTQQATPWHMPIGMTKDGPLWVSLIEGDLSLIGGYSPKRKIGFDAWDDPGFIAWWSYTNLWLGWKGRFGVSGLFRPTELPLHC